MLALKKQWRHLKWRAYRQVQVRKQRILNRILQALYGKSFRSYQRYLHRQAIFAKTHNRCAYCGAKRHLTIDHVFPRARGGSGHPENKIGACFNCNQAKGSAVPKMLAEGHLKVSIGDLMAHKLKERGEIK